MGTNTVYILNSCYNPETSWSKVYVERALSYSMFIRDYKLIFILVNDGSTFDLNDDIHFIQSHLKDFTYLSYPVNKGKGGAIRYGVHHLSKGPIIYTDIDFPYTAQSIFDLILAYDQYQYEYIAGYRDKSYFEHIPLSRKWISKSLILLNKYFLRLKYPDSQAGVKLIAGQAIPIMCNGNTDGFLFEIELIKSITKANLRSTAIPVVLDDDIRVKTLSIKSLLKIGLQYLKEL